MASLTITLEDSEVGQIIDGLTVRMEAYQNTAAFLEGRLEEDVIFQIEEVRDAKEAEKMAAKYDCIITKLLSQKSC